ncbi:MAG: L,D-transpeptidase [Geodermatophilaceae bacterium]
MLATIAVLAAAGCTASAQGSAGPGTSEPPSPAATSTATTTEAAHAPQAVIAVTPPLGSGDFAPSVPVTVTAVGGTLAAVTVTNPEGQAVPGRMSADRRTWQSTQLIGYDSAYTVVADAVNPDGKRAAVNGSFSTVTPRTLTFASVLPNDDIPVVGVGQPISVTFDEDVTDRAEVERRLVVTSTPPVAGSWYWYSDREVHYRPQDYWPANTHVVLDARIYGVNVGDSIFGQEDRHIEFDIDDSMIASVDNDELLLRVYQNGQLVKTMPTAMGKPGDETYSGTYVVMDQSLEYTMDSSTYGVPIDDPDGYRTEVEYASRLSNTGIFVHAAPWSVADQGVRNVSHGCLNVSTDDAAWFYENFGRGDIVEVSGTGVSMQPDDGFGDWNLSWADWQAGSALT